MRSIRAKAGDGRRAAWPFSRDHSLSKDYTYAFCYFISTERERLATIAQLVKFNETCDEVPTIKAARRDIGTKLLSLGLESVDVPADGNCFLHAARSVLLLHVGASVATIRSEVARFLTNARLNVIMDGRTLEEVRSGIEDPPSLGRRRTIRLE